MPNILVRTLTSIRKGTATQKLAVRMRMLKIAILKRFEWIVFYLGRSRSHCKIKAAYLRGFGAEVGKDLLMERSVIIKGAANLKIGDHVGIGSFSLLTCSGGVTIEDYVMISTGCRVISANHRVLPVGEQYRYAGHRRSPIHLKEGCWLATNTIVMAGITIGKGAVVMAGSLVTKNVADYAYVGGVPARFIMYREGYKPPDPDAESR